MAQAPEMVRVPLEELALQIQVLRLGPAAAFLASVPQPPPPAAVDAALRTLRSVGALTEDERLTPLGALCCLSAGRPVYPDTPDSRERRPHE